MTAGAHSIQAPLIPARDARAARFAEWIAFAAWIALTATVAFLHEPWRDEADSWLMARDASVPYLFERMGYAGTPALWYVVLLPFAKLGFPYATQAILHWLIAAAAAALVLWRSPFPVVTRVMLPFTYFFAYEYAVVARSYALTILLLWAIAAMYRERFERPIAYAGFVFLLANANVHSLFFAGTISASYAWELFLRPGRRPRETAALGVMAAGGLLAYLQLRTPADANISGFVSNFLPHAPAQTAREMFFPLVGLEPLWIAGAVILGVVIYGIWTAKQPLFILLTSYAALAYVFVFKWFSGLRHAGLALAILIFVMWIALEADDRVRARLRAGLLAVNLSLIASAASFLYFGYLDARYSYSGAREMATYIHTQVLARNPVIAAHSAPATEAILPYLRGTRFWYAGTEQYGTFMTWDALYKRGLDVSYPEAERRARARFGKTQPYLLLLNVKMPDPERNGYRLLHTNRLPVFAKRDERFYLYEPLTNQ